MTLKDFFKASLRTTLAIFLALLALTAVIAIFIWGRDYHDKQQAQPYEVVKEWVADVKQALSLDIRVRTKVVDGKLLASVEADGYPLYLKAPKNKNSQISIEFVDKDGFKVFSKSVQISEFTSIVDRNGQNSGLDHQFNDYISIDAYKRFNKLQVGWTVDIKATVEMPSTEKTSPLAVLDHCAPSVSKIERLRRLAQHGVVREAGNGEYTAGGKSVYFSYDGTLISCH